MRDFYLHPLVVELLATTSLHLLANPLLGVLDSWDRTKPWKNYRFCTSWLSFAIYLLFSLSLEGEGVFESIWAKVHLGHGKTKILGCVYRPNTTKEDINKAILFHE